MAAQTEFPTFCKRENGTIKKLPQIVYRIANEFLKVKMVKNIYF
jgi:hypothetical protein